MGTNRGDTARDRSLVPAQPAVHDHFRRTGGALHRLWTCAAGTIVPAPVGISSLALTSPCAQVHIPVDNKTGNAKGLAYVTFAQPADSVSAFKALDGTTFQGRLLHILPAMGRAPKTGQGNDGPQSLKQERLEQRKQNAGQAFSWGTLYLNVRTSLAPGDGRRC